MTSEDQIKAVLAKHIKPWEMDGFPCVTGIPEAAAEIAALASTAGAGAGDWFIVPRALTAEMLDAAVKGSRADVSYADVEELWPAVLKAAPAVPASPRSGSDLECENCGSREDLDVIQAKGFRSCCPERSMKSSPAPAEHGVEIRERIAEEVFVGNWIHNRWGEPVEPNVEARVAWRSGLPKGAHKIAYAIADAVLSALSQADAAGRSERAVEIRELSEKATQGPWVYRPDRYDDWGFIRAPRSMADMPGEVVAVSRGEGSDTHDAHRTAGTDPYEHNGRFIVALENDYRSGELVHRSEIAGRSEKGEGEEEGRVPAAPGSREPSPPVSASGFDPSRGGQS